jgi:hypothetical protein
MKNPYILVSIPFYNKSDLTISCLDSLFKSYISGFNWQVILWDDGSSKEELNRLKNSIDIHVGIICNEKNIGYTQTCINAVNYAKHENFDYLFLLNNDTILFQDAFTNLVKRILTNNNIAAVGGKVIHWNENIIIHTGTRIKNNKISDPYCGLEINNPITNHVERRLWVNGCYCLYNLDILRKENLNFNPDFGPAYFEESDLMTELNMRGYSVIYEPKARVRHLVNGTTRDYNFGKIFDDNWNKYLNKWEKYFSSKNLYFQ